MLDQLRVTSNKRADLRGRDPSDDLGLTGKEAADAELTTLRSRLADLQEKLWAEQRQSLLVVLQAMDAGGKDGTIKSVFAGINPQGVKVVGFKAPTPTELAHDYLWRVHAALPARGEIGILNRSHYEDVVVVRVHGLVPEQRWSRRFEHIRNFERMLTDEGTTIVKLFLHISKDEQRERFQERIDDPKKRHKFRRGDLDDRARWADFQAAYSDAINETSTDTAPWYVIPGDRNWVRDLAVARVLVSTLEKMDPKYPDPEPGIDQLKVV